jgi:Zn-dependent M28 family amino/carboxypeptidase
MNLTSLLLLLTVASSPAELRDKAIAGDHVGYEFVTQLTTLFGPRPAGSPAEQKAAHWAADRLRALGFENVHLETFPMSRWIRGDEKVEILSPNPQPVVATALGGAPAAAGVEGEIVAFASMDELIAAPKGSLTGKIAFVDRRTTRMQNGQGYGIAGAARARGPIEAAERGAAGFLLRSIGTDGERRAHTGATHFRDGKVPIPAFAVSSVDADQIGRLLQMGQKVRVRLTSTASLVESQSQNVVADIRGRTDEIVLLGAHLDSWDLGTGAIDDAAGTGIIVGAAKLIADGGKARRTVRVVLYGSEEIGDPQRRPLGGSSYALAHEAELGKHVLTGESDMGADRIYALSLSEPVAASAFGKEALRLLAPIGVLQSRELPRRGGVDVGPLVEKGVPVFVLNQDGSRYFDIHHTAEDTLDKIDRKQFDQNVAAWAALIALAANSDADLREAVK